VKFHGRQNFRSIKSRATVCYDEHSNFRSTGSWSNWRSVRTEDDERHKFITLTVEVSIDRPERFSPHHVDESRVSPPTRRAGGCRTERQVERGIKRAQNWTKISGLEGQA
jgi:hypothetical protein